MRERLKDILLGHGKAHDFWALRDISFDLFPGEVLGIIGRNGSGKSTLLQIVVGTLTPSTGTVSSHGRVAALLELGAGFNMEFTGRENILLNGITLGLSVTEIQNKEKEIIAFAEIGDFIDQPVKYYSSGMFMRLAFAIATSVEPDILVVDEALAVGDPGFVIRCMERVKKLRDAGCAILLVTHDIQTIRSICNRVIWLDNGKLVMSGDPFDVTTDYVRFLMDDPAVRDGKMIATDHRSSLENPQLDSVSYLDGVSRWGNGGMRITNFNLNGGQAENLSSFEHGQTICIQIEALAYQAISARQLGLGFSFRNRKGLDIITTSTWDEEPIDREIAVGQSIQVSFNLVNIMAPGDYKLSLFAEDRSGGVPQYYDFIDQALIFTVLADRPIYSVVLPEIGTTINYQVNTQKD
jgi:lipopolysaccharide transport system ATP-binding protein